MDKREFLDKLNTLFQEYEDTSPDTVGASIELYGPVYTENWERRYQRLVRVYHGSRETEETQQEAR